jgi:hypothetical protein
VGCKILQIPEVRIIHPVTTSREQIPGLPIIQTGAANLPVIQTQQRTEVPFHAPGQLKVIQNQAIKYLLPIQVQVQGVRVAVIVQALRAILLLQEVIHQVVHHLQGAIHQEVLPHREAAQAVHIPLAAVIAIPGEAAQVEVAQGEAEAVQGVVQGVVHLQDTEDNFLKL